MAQSGHSKSRMRRRGRASLDYSCDLGLCDHFVVGSKRILDPGSRGSAPGATFCDHFVVEVQAPDRTIDASDCEKQAANELNPR
jgi:hypothetical protein